MQAANLPIRPYSNSQPTNALPNRGPQHLRRKQSAQTSRPGVLPHTRPRIFRTQDAELRQQGGAIIGVKNAPKAKTIPNFPMRARRDIVTHLICRRFAEFPADSAAVFLMSLSGAARGARGGALFGPLPLLLHLFIVTAARLAEHECRHGGVSKRSP